MTKPNNLVKKEGQNSQQIVSNMASEITKTYVSEMKAILKLPQAWLNVASEITDIYAQEMQNIIEFSNSLNQCIKNFNRSRKRLRH